MAKTFLMLTGCEQIENPFPADQTIGSIYKIEPAKKQN